MKGMARALGLTATGIAAVLLMSPVDALSQRDRQERRQGEAIRSERHADREDRQRVTSNRPKSAEKAVSSQGQPGRPDQSVKRFKWGRVSQKEKQSARVNRSDHRDRSRTADQAQKEKQERSVKRKKRRDLDPQRVQSHALRRDRTNRQAYASRRQFPSPEYRVKPQPRHRSGQLRRGQRNDFRRELGRINGMLRARGYEIPRRFNHPNWVAGAARIYDPRRARYLNGVDLGPIFYIIERYGYGPHLVENYVEYCTARGLSLPDIFLGIQAIVTIVEQFKGCLPAVACAPPPCGPACVPAAACPLPLPLPPPPPVCLPGLPAFLPPLPPPPPLPGLCPLP